MRTSLVTVALLLLGTTTVFAQQATSVPVEYRLRFTWDEPTHNVDGTPATDLASYELFGSHLPIPDGADLANAPDIQKIAVIGKNNTQADATVTKQPDWTAMYFRMRACDTSGNCSALSGEATFTFPDLIPPNAPVLHLTIIDPVTGLPIGTVEVKP